MVDFIFMGLSFGHRQQEIEDFFKSIDLEINSQGLKLLIFMKIFQNVALKGLLIKNGGFYGQV